MATIRKPLLAAAFDPSKAVFPYLATPKIDGIRFLMVNGQAVSRSFKPIRNRHIQNLLSSTLSDGVDGELTVGKNFQDSTSGVMSFDGEPEFTAWVFDYVNPDREEILGYSERIEEMTALNLPMRAGDNYELQLLNEPVMVTNEDDLGELEALWTEQGFEGVMLRAPDGTYKMGRATMRSQVLLKVKQFVDDEAEVIGFVELMHNDNVAEKDAFGRTKRSNLKEGLVPAGTLGALVVRTKEGVEFNIGTGFDAALRQSIWDNREQRLGGLVKYKSMVHGTKDKPRHPVFIGFRHTDDL